MTHPFTIADADRLLGLGDQLFEDWKENADLHRFGEVGPEYVERKAEWDAIRPLFAQSPALRALLEEAEGRWGVKLRYEVPIEPGERREWMEGWLQRVRVVLKGLPVSRPGPMRLPVLDGPS